MSKVLLCGLRFDCFLRDLLCISNSSDLSAGVVAEEKTECETRNGREKRLHEMCMGGIVS